MWPDKACSLCGPKGQGAEKLGPLLGPLADAKGGGQELYVHRLCALWSPEVGQAGPHKVVQCSYYLAIRL